MSTVAEDRSAPDEPSEPDRPPAAGPMTNVITAAVVIVLGGAALIGSRNLGVGTLATPGPGTWPAMVSVTIIALGGVLAIRARRIADAERFTRSSLLVLAAVASMAAYVAVIGAVGFEIPTAVMAFIWLRLFGKETWRTSIIIGLAVTIAFYLLFVAALGVNIPHLF